LAAILAACTDRNLPSTPTWPVARDLSPDLSRMQPTVVVGTGDPNIDVPAVQAAVDLGGEVVLKGRFSFDQPATQPIAPALKAVGLGSAATIRVSTGISITGRAEDDDEMAAIEGGMNPFYVEAPGQPVAIRGVRFVGPTSGAILVYAATGLEIVGTEIEGVVPFAHFASAISLNTSGAIPNPTNPGHPENVSGTVRIEHNDIDMNGGTSADNTLGVSVFSVGVVGAEVDADVSGNRIRNTTEPAINFRRLVGHASIEHNMIATGTIAGTAPRNQAIRVANIGSYYIAHNTIDCGWDLGDAEGIGVFSQFGAWPIEQAVVTDNDIRMNPPDGTVFTAFSAGVGVYGFAQGNLVEHNHIRGSAGAGISIPVFPLPPQAPAAPQDNAFVRNRFEQFTATVADIVVGEHALRTLVVGSGSIDDHGTDTIIDARGDHREP